MKCVWEKLPLQRFYSRLIRLLVGKKRRAEFLNQIGWSSSIDYMIWWFRKLGIPVYYANRFLEPEVFQEIRNLKGRIAIDIGAHVGSYTKLFSENFDVVVAFEPYEPCFKILKTLKMKNADLLPFAISNKVGATKFYCYSHSGHNSILNLRDDGGTYTYVPTLTLEWFIKKIPYLPYLGVDLVKVDVEGGEWLVLEGAENIMHKVKAWVVEIHKERDKERALSFFQSRGYNVKWLRPNHVIARRNEK